ncbi:MAG: hypothetical protein HC850_07255 [Rhodomicrobium sp.]|nr:hypothetical protein [Rhodomicrobium sp.]
MLAAVLPYHPNGALTHLGRKSRGLGSIRHGSSLSRVGASGKPGAVHPLILVELLNLIFEDEPGRNRDSNVEFAPAAAGIAPARCRAAVRQTERHADRYFDISSAGVSKRIVVKNYAKAWGGDG